MTPQHKVCHNADYITKRREEMSAGMSGSGRYKVLACEVLRDELLHVLPSHLEYEFLPYGLHRTPDRLRLEIQKRLDTSEGSTLVLAYGLCGNGTLCLRSGSHGLVLPRVEDCISLLLGSQEARRREALKEPGTYYLTKGWIETGMDPLTEYRCCVEKYGAEKALFVSKTIYAHYTRIALIDTGAYDIARYRTHAQEAAALLGLRYEELPGSLELLRRLAEGNWGHDILTIHPGEEIALSAFAELLMVG
ncbi:MAG: DUF1638 domain-containing protein [Chloroflexi bacterium]|nr:DUF1638 domain-containing protein [Chloroflexota bacterium]